jgi:hypothetical protein
MYYGDADYNVPWVGGDYCPERSSSSGLAIGENKLMPLPDCEVKDINGKNGFICDNSSWIIGRIVRDFDFWMDDQNPQGPIHTKLRQIVDERWT